MESIEAYNKTERVVWVREWMGQAVLCVSQYYWTAEIHKAIKGGSQVKFSKEESLYNDMKQRGNAIFIGADLSWC